jgi:hypothetical protein
MNEVAVVLLGLLAFGAGALFGFRSGRIQGAKDGFAMVAKSLEIWIDKGANVGLSDVMRWTRQLSKSQPGIKLGLRAFDGSRRQSM